MSKSIIATDLPSRQQSTTIESLAISEVFAPGGLIARALPGFEVRRGQQQLAEGIAESIEAKTHLVAEAATGVGKSLSYLISTLATDRQAIICTETKLLQDQLAYKDLPFLQLIWPDPFTWAVIKGRSNYVCRLAYDKLMAQAKTGEMDLFASPEDVRLWPLVTTWVNGEDETGGLADIETSGLSISDQLTQQITVDAHRCHGKQCPCYESCFAERAKTKAKEADLIITNHHVALLDAHLRQKTGNTVQLLPETKVLVIDEAHNLEDTATSVFGTRITVSCWRWLASMYREVTAAKAPTNASELLAIVNQPTTDELDEAMNQAEQVIQSGVKQISDLFQEWLHEMDTERWRPIPPNAAELVTITTGIVDAMGQLIRAAVKAKWSADALQELRRLQRVADDLLSDVTRACQANDGTYARYMAKEEGRFPHVVLCVTPIEVAELLHIIVWKRYQSVIAVSATLRTGGNFQYWQGRVGCPDTANTLVCATPFDYRQQTRLFLPRLAASYVPCQPGQEKYETYQRRMVETISMLLHASQGRALVLCTSVRAMREWATAWRERSLWKVMVQGEQPRARLLREFIDDTHSVLFATRSFWQGIDVPGEALSLLIIDKLPFASPDDPVFAARAIAIDARHGKGASFAALSLPQMALELRQGCGRLIRRSSDRGVIALLDGRIQVKGYGSYILKSLPPAPRVDTVEAVAHFFAKRGSR
jgi:ATP-dependent DNA helicase DinG